MKKSSFLSKIDPPRGASKYTVIRAGKPVKRYGRRTTKGRLFCPIFRIFSHFFAFFCVFLWFFFIFFHKCMMLCNEQALRNLWTHPRSLAITCIQHSLQQNAHFTESALGGLRRSQRQGSKNGPLRVCWICDLLRGLCNLLIIECMNTFEHNIKFVIKRLTWRSVVFAFSEVPETGSKEWALSEFVGFVISWEVYTIYS